MAMTDDETATEGNAADVPVAGIGQPPAVAMTDDDPDDEVEAWYVRVDANVMGLAAGATAVLPDHPDVRDAIAGKFLHVLDTVQPRAQAADVDPPAPPRKAAPAKKAAAKKAAVRRS